MVLLAETTEKGMAFFLKEQRAEEERENTWLDLAVLENIKSRFVSFYLAVVGHIKIWLGVFYLAVLGHIKIYV